MADTVAWSQIEAECDGFRAGFVATFRKYEGQPTDERDGANRVVKVTVRSFATHAGIAEETFRRWTKATTSTDLVYPSDAKARDRAVKSEVRRAVRTDPGLVVDQIMEAPEQTQDQIYHDLKLRRAGVDTSPAHRKAVDAKVADMGAPIRRWADQTTVATLPDDLDKLTERLRDAVSKEIVDGELMERIEKANEGWSIAMAEARLAYSEVQR